MGTTVLSRHRMWYGSSQIGAYDYQSTQQRVLLWVIRSWCLVPCSERKPIMLGKVHITQVVDPLTSEIHCDQGRSWKRKLHINHLKENGPPRRSTSYSCLDRNRSPLMSTGDLPWRSRPSGPKGKLWELQEH